PGVLTVIATNSITATNIPNVVVAQGTYRLGMAAGLPSAARVVIGAGATLDLNGFTANLDDLSGYGTINLGSTRVLALGGAYTGTGHQFAGALAGAGTLRLPQGTGGVYSVSGHSPSFTGGVEVLGGQLNVNSQTALGTGTSPILLGPTTGTGAAWISFGT